MFPKINMRVIESRIPGLPEPDYYHPGEAIIPFAGDSQRGFDEKKRWLIDRGGLVFANPSANAIGPIQAQYPGALENILVYEDARVVGDYKGLWRVHCNYEADKESSFYFRYWSIRQETITGLVEKDPLWSIIKEFVHQFKPSGIYQFGRNYRIEVDWESV
ncbi:MAG: hypothetical protein AABX47_05850 [Nanoarchaeota archaeon]